MNLETWWDNSDWGQSRTQKKMSQWHFTTTNHTQSGPGLNPILCSEISLPQPRQGSSLQYALEIRLYNIIVYKEYVCLHACVQASTLKW